MATEEGVPPTLHGGTGGRELGDSAIAAVRDPEVSRSVESDGCWRAEAVAGEGEPTTVPPVPVKTETLLPPLFAMSASPLLSMAMATG